MSRDLVTRVFRFNRVETFLEHRSADTSVLGRGSGRSTVSAKAGIGEVGTLRAACPPRARLGIRTLFTRGLFFSGKNPVGPLPAHLAMTAGRPASRAREFSFSAKWRRRLPRVGAMPAFSRNNGRNRRVWLTLLVVRGQPTSYTWD